MSREGEEAGREENKENDEVEGIALEEEDVSDPSLLNALKDAGWESDGDSDGGGLQGDAGVGSSRKALAAGVQEGREEVESAEEKSTQILRMRQEVLELRNAGRKQEALELLRRVRHMEAEGGALTGMGMEETPHQPSNPASTSTAALHHG